MLWKEEMGTGIKELDEKTKVFVEGVNEEIRKLSSARTSAIIVERHEKIKGFCVEYFSYQEAMMMMVNYPIFHQHKHSHEMLLTKVELVINEYLESGYVFSSTQMDNVFTEWFMKHAYMDDKNFAKFYLEKRGIKK